MRADYPLAHVRRKEILELIAASKTASQVATAVRTEPPSSSSSSSQPQPHAQNGFADLTLLVSAAEGSNPRFPLEAESPALLPGFEDYKMKSAQVKIEPKETGELPASEPSEAPVEFQSKRAKMQKTTEPKSQEKEKEKGKKGRKKK